MKTILLLCALLLAACEDRHVSCGVLVPVRFNEDGEERSLCNDDLCRGKFICAGGEWQPVSTGPWYSCVCPANRAPHTFL